MRNLARLPRRVSGQQRPMQPDAEPCGSLGGVVRKVDPILGAPKPRGPVALCSSGACGLEGPAQNSFFWKVWQFLYTTVAAFMALASVGCATATLLSKLNLRLNDVVLQVQGNLLLLQLNPCLPSSLRKSFRPHACLLPPAKD